MKELLKRHKDYLGPAFVLFEAAMHVYLVIYLTFNWTNWAIWLFTAFELTMFIYLLVTGKKDKENQLPTYCECGRNLEYVCFFHIGKPK